MAFLIPDNLRSRKDVPEPIRRVAAAFQVSLDEDVTVWFEPPYDPTGQKPHMVLLVPDRGIIVLEALAVRRQAYGNDAAAIERCGDPSGVENPFGRAEKLANLLRERVRALGASASNVPVGFGAVFPSQSREEVVAKGARSQLDLKRCLFAEEVESALRGEGEGLLIRAFGRMLDESLSEPLTSGEEDLIRVAIQPETVIRTIANSSGQIALFRDEDAGTIIKVMDRQQEAMAKALGVGHRVIRGVAGSGKTLILTYRARLLSKLRPNDRILVTCYTRTLTSQLRDSLRDCHNVDVMNLDRLMYQAIKQARLTHPGFKGKDAEVRIGEMACQALAQGAGARYHAVLLDEAQDFVTEALRFVVGLLVDGHDDLVVVADAAQNIFRRNFSWKSAGIQAQGRTRILRKNYRNTREVLEVANRFLLSGDLRAEDVPDPEDEHTVIPPESAARSGNAPTLYVERNIEDAIDTVVQTVLRWTRHRELSARNIAILFGSQYDQKRNLPEVICSRLSEMGVDVFWMSKTRESKDSLAAATESVVLSTIHSAKGLEFPKVLVCGIGCKEDKIESMRKLAYVGMTRATEELVVVARDGDHLVRDLESAWATESKESLRVA